MFAALAGYVPGHVEFLADLLLYMVGQQTIYASCLIFGQVSGPA